MKRKKIIILGTLATIPIIVTSVSCGEANTNVNEIKVAIAKQYVSDYYNIVTKITPGAPNALIRQKNPQYKSTGLDSVNSIKAIKLDGLEQYFDINVSANASVISIPDVTFSIKINIDTLFITYNAFNSTEIKELGDPYNSGGDVALMKILENDNNKLLIQMIKDYSNSDDPDVQEVMPKAQNAVDPQSTGRDIIFSTGDNIYAKLDIEYTTAIGDNSVGWTFMSVWNKKTNITTIPELNNKVWN